MRTGQPNFGKNKFQSFIENSKFISSLEQFILDPIEMNFRKFSDAWETQARLWDEQAPSHKLRKNPILVNRVAAACTLEVSTTVDEKKFDEVLDWLITENAIPSCIRRWDQNWFSKNSTLMKYIKGEFRDDLQNKKKDKIDEFYLNLFIWVLYEARPSIP
ncbi:MAG: hypothetical protein ACR2PY_00590 [Salinispira sp.]